MDELEMIKRHIKSFLLKYDCKNTYTHCLAVGEYAYTIAQKYLKNPEKAKVAGYLHDISAIYPNNERIRIANEMNIEILVEEREFPTIIHQKISKNIAKEFFGIDNAEILSAIECHTTLKIKSI